MGWKNLPRPGFTGRRIATRLAVVSASKGTWKDHFFSRARLYHPDLTRNRHLRGLSRALPGIAGPARAQIAGMHERVIHLHRDAPPKPALGEPCNGCGACCAAEPCPIGAVVSLRRSGRCTALEWSDEDRRYRCGILLKAAQGGRPARRLVTRWIGAGIGCDATLEVASAAVAVAEESEA
jgi:hypothetical protein